jgi:hypothetical protein
MAWETSGFSMPSVLPKARLGHGSNMQSRSPRLSIPLSSRGVRYARPVKMQDGGLEGEEVRPEIKTKGSKSHGTDVVVIGAGLGGLSAGALLVMKLLHFPLHSNRISSRVHLLGHCQRDA